MLWQNCNIMATRKTSSNDADARIKRLEELVASMATSVETLGRAVASTADSATESKPAPRKRRKASDDPEYPLIRKRHSDNAKGVVVELIAADGAAPVSHTPRVWRRIAAHIDAVLEECN